MSALRPNFGHSGRLELVPKADQPLTGHKLPCYPRDMKGLGKKQRIAPWLSLGVWALNSCTGAAGCPEPSTWLRHAWTLSVWEPHESVPKNMAVFLIQCLCFYFFSH